MPPEIGIWKEILKKGKKAFKEAWKELDDGEVSVVSYVVDNVPT